MNREREGWKRGRSDGWGVDVIVEVNR
jgi:hypothetical protein